LLLFRTAAANEGFSAMLAEEYVLIFLFAISSGPSCRNSIELLFLSSSSVILLGCSSGLDEHKFQHSSKPCSLAAILSNSSIIEVHDIENNIKLLQKWHK
jgi:hypothetical protein